MVFNVATTSEPTNTYQQPLGIISNYCPRSGATETVKCDAYNFS